ncbi:pyridine nucleotide-disulfide oxidoreductase [Sphingobacteriaceae bacterium]|nr:pyridine nucleotide-disulfide oxidoreductase [Sphingobacteriaceae bacterium]
MDAVWDVLVIGGGQSGLASGYYLKRAGLNYIILDDRETGSGAWLHGWDSLTLFSPAQHSSLPGWMMPKSETIFPLKKEVINYLLEYEKRYLLPIKHSVKVKHVVKEGKKFRIETDKGDFFARTVISATGTWSNPFIPNVKGIELYTGDQSHSASYKNSDSFIGSKVLIVGEGNSGAQLIAEVSKVASVKWSTKRPPEFLPDNVDGHVLFNAASAKYHAEKEGKPFDQTQYSLGNVVMVPPVKEARERGVLHSVGNFNELYERGVIWADGTKEEFDAIIWCTGFGYVTQHLASLIHTDERGKAETQESKSMEVDGLWLVGYGGWTGFASATLIGVGRTARDTVKQIEDYLKIN